MSEEYGFDQMEFDVTLDSVRELKENVNVAIDFACRQLKTKNLPTVVSRHEGYGILVEQVGVLNASQKLIGEGMKNYTAVLAAGDSDAVSAASKVYNAACAVAFEAMQVASQANRVMTDLYMNQDEEKTPLEEYLEEEEDEFQDAEEEADQDEAEAEGTDPEAAEDLEEDEDGED